MGLMGLGETITVVNRSGKVVSSRKHIVNVFKEAQSAYRERKAETKATRNADLEEKQAGKSLKHLDIKDDNASRAPSRHSRRSSRSSTRTDRPVTERGYSDSFYTNDEPRSPRTRRRTNLRFSDDLEDSFQRGELIRRNTDNMISHHSRPKTARSSSLSDIDMDLAYGELPPPLPPRKRNEEMELRGQMSKLQQLLDELNCVQHSAMATIENLQNNPEALAAVALTLGEISNIASKMAPGVLMAMKSSFPVIIALLASPEFMIAAGVGLGVTVIALGGYKIIKKIKQRRADAKGLEGADCDELQEISGDLSRIEMWRRGIAEADAGSLGTSVEGEFVTPAAGKRMIEEGIIGQDDLISTIQKTKAKSKSKGTKPVNSESGNKDKQLRKKEPSGLKMLFKRSRQPEPALI